MGASQSTGTGVARANKGVYNMVQAHVAAAKGATGGGNYAGGYFGGDATDEPSKALKEYRHSLAAASKERIVRGLARALSRAGIDVDPGAGAEEIAKALQSKLPNPRKGKTFAADAKAQEKVCRTIADVLNDEFTPGVTDKSKKLIDTSLGAVSVCRQVAELVHSVSAGLHTEFLEVHASLTRIIRNLEVLDEVLAGLHKQLQEQLRAADLSAGSDKQVASFEEVYERAQRARETQMSMLKNFLSVTLAPAKEELAIAMRSEGETHDIIKRLELVPGTSKFADSLAEAISGLGTVAAISARVDKALKEVGLSVEQYLASPDFQALENNLDDKLMSSGKVKADAVGKFLMATQTLRENFYRRSELDLGDGEVSGAYEGGSVHHRRYRGGDDSSLDKRVKKSKMEKKVIVSAFAGKATRKYDELLKAIQELGPQLGKTIPLSDKLASLRNTLSSLTSVNMNTLNLELILLGYRRDAGSREEKEKFLSGLRAVLDILDDLMGMEMYRGSSHYFAAVRAAIDGLVRTIDYYSDILAKTYGSGGDEEAGGEIAGGDGEEDYELSTVPEAARSSYDLDRAINTFLYFFYVAKVRSNLKQTHKELEHYGEKYNNILGDAVAARLRALETKKTAELARFATVKERMLVLASNAAQPAWTVEEANKEADALKKFIEEEYACKASFYRALQALDLYLKAFTDGIVAHPDDVADVKRMLDGVSVIGRWFTESTGDSLAAAFDQMPADTSYHDATGPGADVWVTEQPAPAGDGHYYEKIIAGGNISGNTGHSIKVGHPFIMTGAAKGGDIKTAISKTYDNFQALKNITNSFIRIGDKFGGRELRRMGFMSPTQIYKALIGYLKCSALSYDLDHSPGVEVDNLGAPVEPDAFGETGMIVAERGAPLAGRRANRTEGNKYRFIYFNSSEDRAGWGAGHSFASAELQGNYQTEDKYFTYCVKAMAAKVLTVIGVYDLFERPSPVYELTPTRMIIGGADDDVVPEVIPEATELYLRLPRLVEFYKNLFGWNETRADRSQISMLSEVEGVFSGIISLIFDRVQADAAATGNYSDFEVKQIVREVNSIYENFKSAGESNATSEALSAFVAEINRRYGVVKASEYKKYKEFTSKERREVVTGYSGLETNYAILPDEDEAEFGNRLAPSDRYLQPGASTPVTTSGKYKIDSQEDGWVQWQLLAEFRQKLDKMFEESKASSFATHSFAPLIRQGETEIRRSEDAAAKIGIAARLIQGSANILGDADKSYMFHETVVVGLNALNGIHSMLRGFRKTVKATDLKSLRDTLFEHAKTLGPAAAAFPGANGFTDAYVSGLLPPDPQAFVRPNANLLANWGGAPNNATAATFRESIRRRMDAERGAGGAISDGTAHTWAIYNLDDVKIMETLLYTVNAITTTFQDLVVVRFPGTSTGHIQLDFTKLRHLIQSLMSDVRYYLDLFRPHVSKAVIEKYEAASNAGSLYWLERELIDGFVTGPPDASIDVAANAETLEWMSRTINTTYDTLIGCNKYTLAGMRTGNPLNVVGTGAIVAPDAPDQGAVANAEAGNDTTGKAYYGQFGNLLCKLVFYDAGALTTNGARWDDSCGFMPEDPNNLGTFLEFTSSGTRVNESADPLDNLIRANRVADRPATYPSVNGGNPARMPIWQTDVRGIGERHRSMVMVFNQLLAKYIRSISSNTNKHFYSGLLNSFANGSFSSDVMIPGNSFPDLAQRDINFGVRGDVTANGVLFESLSLVLKRVVTDVNPTTQTSDYLVDTLSDIPLFIREGYRANLPVYIKLFELVQKTGDFYKQIMAQTQIQVGRWTTPNQAAERFNGGAAIPAGSPVVIVRANGQVAAPGATNRYSTVSVSPSSIKPLAPESSPGQSREVKPMLEAVINKVNAGCYTLASAAAEVLRELADEPLYLQTHENSIQEYKARVGKLPLMPLSTALYVLKNMSATELTRGSSLLPERVLGDPVFKFMYGTRKMFGRPATKFALSDAPGVRADLDTYNSTIDSRYKIDTARHEQFVHNVVTGLRYLVDIRHYRSSIMIRPQEPVFIISNTMLAAVGDGSQNGIIVAPDGRTNCVYSIAKTLEDSLAITESVAQDREQVRISKMVDIAQTPREGPNTRDAERIRNIIDMNIMPINVHALMRGIPFAPLYNYAYTFEQMSCMMLGERVETIRNLVADQYDGAGAGVKNTRQFLLKMLLEPYVHIAAGTYGLPQQLFYRAEDALLARIFRGDDSLLMGRPKFLSDQLYNKVLFGSLIPRSLRLDETGPAGAARALMRVDGPVVDGTARPNADATNLRAVPVGTEPVWVAPGGNQRQEQVGTYGNRPAALGDDIIYGALTYIAQPENTPAGGTTAVKAVSLGAHAANQSHKLWATGFARFNTRIVRNLFFIANVQRLMRLKLNQELTQYRNVLVSSHGVINPGVTEYGSLPWANTNTTTTRQEFSYNPAYETTQDRRYDDGTRLLQ